MLGSVTLLEESARWVCVPTKQETPPPRMWSYTDDSSFSGRFIPQLQPIIIVKSFSFPQFSKCHHPKQKVSFHSGINGWGRLQPGGR